eukprot:5809981-Prymnesium_polylepis.1
MSNCKINITNPGSRTLWLWHRGRGDARARVANRARLLRLEDRVRRYAPLADCRRVCPHNVIAASIHH